MAKFASAFVGRNKRSALRRMRWESMETQLPAHVGLRCANPALQDFVMQMDKPDAESVAMSLRPINMNTAQRAVLMTPYGLWICQSAISTEGVRHIADTAAFAVPVQLVVMAVLAEGGDRADAARCGAAKKSTHPRCCYTRCPTWIPCHSDCAVSAVRRPVRRAATQFQRDQIPARAGSHQYALPARAAA